MFKISTKSTMCLSLTPIDFRYKIPRMPDDKRTMAIYKAVGRVIADVRNHHGLTQAELADRTGGRLSRSAIANIESGRQRVALHHLIDIAEALGIDAQELMPSMQDVPPLPTTAANEFLQKLTKRSGPSLLAPPGGEG